jgi:N-acetyl-gamma-glutamyl-phosphate reductase
MGMTASVVGASGYGGGELLRLLAGHDQISVGAVAAASNAGKRLGEVHPHLVTLADLELVADDHASVSEADVVFLALPHGESARVVTTLPDDVAVVDLGADFRLGATADWTRWYGGEHAGQWPYGLPELPGARERIAGAKRVANPGCYATAIALAYAPLLAAGLVSPDDLVTVAASGTSGAGRAAKPHLLGTEVMGDLWPYKVGVHQHMPEIRQALAAAAGGPISLSFTPVLAPMPRGILATCTARLASGATAAAVRAAMTDAYADEAFVHVLPAGMWPHTAATLGSNSCQLGVDVDHDAGRVIITSALDNLGKGAAGQAIQNANLILGLPETTGLPVNGVAP